MHKLRFFTKISIFIYIFLLPALLLLPREGVCYDKQTFDAIVKESATSSSFCGTNLKTIEPLFQAAWIKAHMSGINRANLDDEITKFSELPHASLSQPLQVLLANHLPDLHFPPYLQRTCHIKAQLPSHKTEEGFLVFAYFIHNGQINDFFIRWDSNATVSRDFHHFQQRVDDDRHSTDPFLRSCRAKYPRTRANNTSRELQEAAFDVRTRLILSCVKEQHALSHLYSDSFFIHR